MNIELRLYFLIGLLAIIISILALKVFDKFKCDVLISDIIAIKGNDNEIKNKVSSIIYYFKYNKEDTKKKLITAGIYNEFVADGYYIFKMVPFISLVIILSYFLYCGFVSLLVFVLSFSIGLIMFLVVPDMYIANRGKLNINRMNHRLPFLLDLMNICINTGMTIEASLSFLAKEISIIDRDLAYVIKNVVDRTEVVGIHKALTQFHEMIPTPEAKSFTMIVRNNVDFGSSIGPILLTLASDIREVNMLGLEEKVGKMSAKMSIPMIVFIMIPVVVLIVAPGIMRIFMA